MEKISKWSINPKEPRVRHGKTAIERRQGNAARNHANKVARDDWSKDRKATNNTFPVHTLGGK